MPDGFTSTIGAMAARFGSKAGQFATVLRQQGEQVVRTQAISVHEVIVRTSPVDTGFLRQHWSPVRQGATPLTWGTSTDVPYAPTLEYGGYRHVGHNVPPKTVRLGGGALGAGFTAGPGIYSTQAPLGWVRKALAQAKPQYILRLQRLVQDAWQRGGTTGGIGGLPPVGASLSPSRTLVLSPGQLGALFGIDII